LTEAEKLDVRAQIAAAAGVSAGNVSKVKHLMTAAGPELLKALRSGEISIHRAWNWSKSPLAKQEADLRQFRDNRGIKQFIQTRIARHRTKRSTAVEDLSSLLQRLVARESAQLRNVSVAVVKTQRETVFITESLLRLLERQQMDFCATSGR
jgi:hypothetical protein